ncbi:FMN-dependent dehydrogenase [Diplocarpon rosae]|nr:FMN-dependent dehydrogenase [Diplocarpon rosae]
MVAKSAQEVSQHNVPEDLWVIVNNNIYDLTEFAPNHPGGTGIIHHYAGRDASSAYNEIHAPSLIQTSLTSSKHVGVLSLLSRPAEYIKPPPRLSHSKAPLATLLSTHDFVGAARSSLTPKTWAFYSSAATDLHTMSRNASAYSAIGLRPRVLVDVKAVDTRTEMLGQRMRVPIFCAPAAMAAMAHPDGEKGIARGCRRVGIPQCVSTNASFPLAEIFQSVSGSGQAEDYYKEGNALPIFFQLYVDKQRAKSEELLKTVEELGVRAIFVTVDAPVPGKREADERVAADESLSTPMSGARAKNDSKGGALGRIMGGYIDASLSWSDVPWLRAHTSLPLVLKGVQTYMDVLRAADLGIEAVVLSNHGGRSLDTAPAPVLLLLELQRNCPAVFDRLEVFVDGGIMRGTDIFKALCLGARCCGVGRGFLYALSYGCEGVEKYVEILKDELETTMRMMGVTDLSQVHPGLLNTGAVDHLIPYGEEHPYAKWRPKARI